MSACDEGKLRLWQTASAGPPVVLGEEEGIVNAVAGSPDGKRIATGTAGGVARIRDLSSAPATVVSGKLLGGIARVSFSPDGRQVLLVAGERAWVWNGTTAGAPAQIGTYADVRTASFSNDGRKIVLAGSDRRVRILSADNHAEERTWQAHGPEGGRPQILTAMFSPDAKRVLTAGADMTARIYETATGAELAVLRGHEAPVVSAALSANGWILTTSSDRTVRLWTAFGTPQALVDYARAHMPRELTRAQRERYFLDPSPAAAAPRP